MPSIDVFNGDADGLCALRQLRLHDPRPRARIVTGIKRDIRLLTRLHEVTASDITVLDISLAANNESLTHLLDQNNTIVYIDHHFAGKIPRHPRLVTHIDPSPSTCTSRIVDTLLQGRFRSWALVGAFGDNLHDIAREMAVVLNLREEELEGLRELGTLLNYNGYGERVEDLHIDPALLFQTMQGYDSPLTLWREDPLVPRLRQGYRDDMQQALARSPMVEAPGVRAFQLPDAPWARRVGGSFAHHLARERDDLASAVLQLRSDGSWRVSVRAARRRPRGADQLCRRYPGGGGRAAAAGINALPAELLDPFLSDLCLSFHPDTSQ